MLVVIIDDGLTLNIRNLTSKAWIKKYYVDESNKITEKGMTFGLKNTHSDICFGIFDYYINMSYDLINIDISMNQSRCNIDKLITALQWCILHKVDLINMSVGTTYYGDFYLIEKHLKILQEHGTVIVASHSNDNYLTLPASSENVIGVRCSDSNLLAYGEYVVEEDLFGKTVVVSSELNTLFSKLKSFHLNNFNSYATAYISYLCFELINKGLKGIEQVLTSLEKRSKKIIIPKGDIKTKNNIKIPIVGYDVSNKLRNYFIKSVSSYFFDKGYRVFFLGNGKEKESKYNCITYNRLVKYIGGNLKTNLNYIVEFAQVDLLFIDMNSISGENDNVDLLVTDKDCKRKRDKIIKLNKEHLCNNLIKVCEEIVCAFS